METVDLLLDGGDSGPAVIPGKAEESLIYQLAAQIEDPVMPPEDNDVGAKRLNEEQLLIIKNWINQGADDEPSDGLAKPEIQWRPIPDKHASIVAVEVSPDGRWLATGRGNQLRVYSVVQKKLHEQLVDPAISETHPESAHLDSVQSIAWSHDQKWLASGGFRTVKIWKRESRDANAEDAGDAKAEASTGTRTLSILSDDMSVAKLVDKSNEKELASLQAKTIHDEEIAQVTYHVGLLQQRLDVLNKDVENAKKRKKDAENDVKKAVEEIKKAIETVAKAAEAEKKAKETHDKKQMLVSDSEMKFADLNKKWEALTKQIAEAEEAKKAELNAEKSKVEQEKNKLKGELDKAKKEAAKLKQEFEKQQTTHKDAVKSVERSKNAKVRLEKTVEEKAVDIKKAEGIASEHNEVVGKAKTNLEDAKKMASSPWKHVEVRGDTFCLVNQAGKSATYSADGSLLSIDNETTGSWKLVKTLGGPGEDVFADRITSLAFRPDGKLLAIGGGEPSRSGEVQLWKTENWSKQASIKDVHSDVVYDLEFAPLGQQLVSCASDRMMKLIDSGSGELLRTFEGHTGHVLGVSWRADGRTLATAGADKVVKVWDALEGGQKKTISGFKGEVTSVRYMGLDNRMIFATGRGLVHSRDSEGNGKQGFGQLTDYVHRVSSSRDGKVVAAAGTDRKVRVWGADGKQIVEFQ